MFPFLTHLSTLYSGLRIVTKLTVLRLWFWKSGLTCEFYARALQFLRNENILFTKIFQALAHSKYTHFSPELQTQLLHYTANTSYTESEIDYETLDSIETRYGLLLDRNVVNSGMIALVFHGTRVCDGLPIIVKLKRKGILPALQQGCESVRILYSYAVWFAPKNTLLRLLKSFIANIGDILDQCDFNREIANLRQAAADFADLPCITIPTVLNLPTTTTTTSYDPTYILMNRLEGSHSLPPGTSDETRLQYLEYFCRFMCHGFSRNTIQHTDLHSGNILFQPAGLGIIDFGMAFQLTDAMYDMILSVATIIMDKTPIHEIDFIETFGALFVPPLAVRSHEFSNIEDLHAVEDLCIAITEPLFQNMDLDELVLTEKLEQLSKYLHREIVLHKDLYKIILGMTMMGNNAAIMGTHFAHPEKIRAVERRVLAEVFTEIMLG